MRVATPQEVAEMLRVSPDTVYRLAAKGELPSFRVGVALRFDLDELEPFLKQRQVVAS